MDYNNFMVGAPKMNASTYYRTSSDSNIQNIPTVLERKQLVLLYEGIPTSLAEVYQNKLDMTDSSYKEEKKEKDSSFSVLDTIGSMINPLGTFASKLYNSNIGQSIVEKAVETNIRSLEGDLTRKELRTMQSIDFLIDYEKKRQQLQEAINNNDIDTANQLQQYIDNNAELYQRVIKTNGKIAPLYYDLNKGHMYLTLDRNKTSVAERLPLTLSTMFSNKEDTYAEIALQGLSDAVENVKPKDRVWNNPDRTDIIKQLENIYKDLATSQELKLQKIKDRKNILKNGSWFFDPDQIDPTFRLKVNSNEFEWGKLSSYPYAIPQLGSSLGELVTTVETATLGRLVSYAAKKFGSKNPYGAAVMAIGEFGLNAANNYYQRSLETNAELFDSYLNSLVNKIDSGNIDAESVLRQGISQLKDRGIKVDELTMPELLEQMLLYNIKTDNQEFENTKLSAYNGLDNVWQSNMALGIWDVLDMSLYSYGGKLAVKSAKETLKSGAETIAKATKLDKVAHIANDIIDTRINRALYKMAGKDVFVANKYSDILNTVGRMGTKLGITAFSESTEEGQQYLIQKEYEALSLYNPVKMNLVDAFLKNFKYGTEANLALMGLHPDDALNNDKELEQNMKIGALIGLLMGGSGTVISDGYQLIRDVKSNKLVRNMAAYDISNREEDSKVDRWYDAVKKGYTTDVILNLRDIRDRFKPEGITEEDLNEDIEKAALIESIYHNTDIDSNLKELGIKVGSELHKTFTKNALKAYSLEREYNKQAKKAYKDLNDKISEFYSSDDFGNKVNEFWENLSREEQEQWGSIEVLKDAIKLLQIANTTASVLNKLKTQLKDLSSFISKAKESGIDVTNDNIAAIVQLINREQRKFKNQSKEEKKLNKQLSDTFGSNTDSLFELLIADNLILTALLSKAVNRRSAYLNGVVLSSELNRAADFNVKYWKQLTEEEKQEVRDKYNKEAEEKGEQPYSDKSIATRYNNSVIAENKPEDKVTSAREYANEIILSDMNRYQRNSESYEELDDDLRTDILNETEITEQSSEVDDTPDFTPTGEGDNAGSQIGQKDLDVRLKEQEEQEATKEPVEDIYLETDEDKLTGDEDITDISEMDISEMVTSDDDVSSTKKPAKTEEKTEEQIEAESKDDTKEKIDLENLTDPSNFMDPNEVDAGLTALENPFLDPTPEPEATLPPAIEASLTEEPVEQPYIDPDTLERTTNKSVPDAEDFFINKDGKMFLNGKEVTDELIAKENAADNYANDPNETLSEKANKVEKDNGSIPGLSSSESILNSWLVGKTLFYRPDATTAMKLPFEVKGMKTLHTGQELAIAMGDPNFLSDANIYFVPGPTMSSNEKKFDPNNPTTYSNAAVYMVIDKNGEIYVAAYRSNEKAAIDYIHRLGTVEKGSRAAEDLNTLAKQKEKIVQYYLQKCEKDKDGKYILPKLALTHVRPTQIHVSNGTYNTQKEGKKPIFRKLTECKTFEIPEDPNKILQECTFGYGVGGILVGYKADPYAIKQLGSDEVLSKSGGFAGKIVIYPKPSATPRGKYSSPIYLCEKFFRDDDVKDVTDIKLKSHDDKGNVTPNGKYHHFMEYVLDLITDGDPYGILPLIINQGEKTKLSEAKLEQAQFLAKKQIGYDPDTETFYIATPRKDRGGLYFRANIPISQVKTDPRIRKAIIWYMMQNYHWNMDKNVLSSSIPESLRDLAVSVLKPEDTKLVLFPGELEFTLDELGISKKNGKLVKNEVAPPAIAWYINSGKLLTDMGDYAFKGGFIYAEDITIDPASNTVISTEPIATKAKQKESDKAVELTGIKKPVESKPTEPATENKPINAVTEDRKSRRVKAQELAKSLKQPDANAPKVSRYMTSDEIEEYVKSKGQKAATNSFVYLYDQDGNPQMLIKSMLEKVFQEIGQEATFYTTGMYSTEENEADRVSQNLKEAKEWLMDKLGLSTEQVMVFNGVMRSASNGPRVYGVTRLAANGIGNIILGQGSGKGIQYHEAWHYVNMLVHSPRERLIVYEDFIKHNPQYKNASINEIEEAMAEDFRNWAITQNSKQLNLGYRTIKLFRAVLDFVKSILGMSDRLYINVYKNINKGKYSNYKMNLVSVEEFNKAFTDKGAFFSIPGVSQDKLNSMPSIINPDVFYDILDSLTSTLLSVFNIRSASDISKLTTDLDYLPQIIQGNLDMGLTPEENEQLIEEVLDNWDIFKKEIAEHLSVLNIKATEVEQEDSDSDYSNGEKDPQEKYDRVSFEFSKKLNMSFNAKLFFYSIPKVEYNLEKELVPVVDPIFGLNMTESFDVTWNKIMENLWDIEKWEDLESRCLRLGKADPFFLSLYNYISGSNKPDENTCTQILTTIKSAKNEMTTIQFEEAFAKSKAPSSSEMVFDIKTSTQAVAGKWSILDSSILRLQNKYPRQWGKLFYVSGMIDKSNPKFFHINEGKLDSFEAQFDVFKEDIDTLAYPFISKKKQDKFPTLQEIRQTTIDVKQRLVEWLNSVGIDVDIKSIDYLLYGIESANDKLPSIEGFDKLYTLLNQSGKGNIRNQIIGNLRQLVEGETSKLKLNNPFPLAEGSFIQKMAIAHGKSHPNPSEFSITGPNNTTIYPITLNNYMSDRIRWFNNDINEVVKARKATYNKHSRLLQALLDGSKLSLSTFIAVKNNDGKTNRDYFEISPIEDYISKLTLAHNDRITLPTMADKKTWYSISGVLLFHDMLSKSKLKNVMLDGVVNTMFIQSDIYSFSDNTIDAFANYLLDEFNSIEEYYLNKSKVEHNLNLKIDNYHGKIKNGKMDNSGNGGYFRYFSSIKMKNSDGKFEYVPLNQLLWMWSKFDYDNNKNQMPTRLKLLRERLFGDIEILRENINATLLDRVQEELDFLVSKGMIKRTRTGEYENILLPKNILKDYSERSKKLRRGDTSRGSAYAELYSLVANHVVNQMASIIEVEKAFVGDPAFYKWKRDKKQPWIITERSVDKIKRLGSVLSTGDNLRTWWGDGDPRNNSKFTVLHVTDNQVGSIKFSEYKKMFTAAEVMKYIERANPTIDQSRLVNMVNKDNISKTLKSLNPKVRKQIEESVDRLIAAYGINDRGEGNINQADAAVYIRPALYKRIVQAVGEWSPEVERAFELLESENESWLSDPKLYSQAIETLIKPLKMVYFGNHELNNLGLSIPVFDKMAIFPLFRVMAKADNYHLYKRMNDETLGTIDMLTFESAVKVGGRQKYTAYKDPMNNEFNLKDLNKPSTSTVVGETNIEGLDTDNSKLPTYIQDLRNLRLQMNTDPHEHTDRSLGTQFAKVALSNLIKNRPYGHNKGVEYTGRLIVDNIFNAINRLSDIGAQKIFDEFTDDGALSPVKLSNFLIRQAKDSGLSRDVVSSFEIDEASGQMKVPLSAQSNRRFIESRIISQVGKTAIDINTPGGSAIQHAFFGFKKTTGIVELDLIGRAFNDGKDLSPLNEDGSMDCMLSTNFFRHIVPKKIQQLGYTAIRNWLLEKNIIGNDAKPFALGYRIPTQGLSSTASLKVTDVLPESMGDVIVVPNDFTAMTGSDFDIDKLYICTGYYDEEGNYLKCNWDDISSNSELQLVNGLIDMYRIAISDDTNIDQTKAPLDNLTNKVKENILPLVMGKSKNEAKPMYELLPSYQLFKKFEYTGGKDGIAPFALASTNHALTQALNLRMHLGTLEETYQLGNINDINSQDGERILDWLSAMINAHVDVAKDPYIINLNVNAVTYSMTEFLLRTGKGETTFYFLSQPILKDFANTIIKLNGQYGVNPSDTSYSLLIDTTLNELITQYIKDAKNYIETLPEEQQSKYNNILRKLGTEESIVSKSDAVNVNKLVKSLTANINQNRDIDFYIQLILVANAYKDMLPYADRLTKLVRLSLIDTKKYGNTLAQQANYSRLVFDFISKEGEMFYQIDDSGNVIEDTNSNALLNYYTDSFLMTKLKHAVDIPKYLLRNDFIQATEVYGNMFNNMISYLIGDRGGINKQLATKLDSILDSVIRGKIANNTKDMHIEDGELRDMVLGDRTVPKRLYQLKHAIYKNINGRYDNLLNGDGSISNAFLNYLIPTLATGDIEGAMDAITLLNNSMSNSSNFENRLIAYFSDLLSSNDPAVKQFAKRLALYAYYTSYDNKSPNTFSHLISSQFRIDSGYALNIRKLIMDMNAGSWLDEVLMEDLDMPLMGSYPSLALNIARNNVMDGDIVKNVVKPRSTTYNSNAFIRAASPWTDYMDDYLMSFSINSRKDERDFLSVDYPYNGNRNTVLYVKIGRMEVYDKSKGKKLGLATLTIYVAVPRLGYSSGSNSVNEYHKGSFDLSDFSDNNIETLSYKFLNSLFNDQSKYKVTVKGVNSKNLDIHLVPSPYFTTEFNKYGRNELLKDIAIDETIEDIDNNISKEVNDEQPTLLSDKPKSKAIRTKQIDKLVAAESGLLDKGNLMNKVNQLLMMTEAMAEAVPMEDPLSMVESSGQDVTDLFTTEDDLSEDNFSDEAYKTCKGK